MKPVGFTLVGIFFIFAAIDYDSLLYLVIGTAAIIWGLMDE